MKEKIELKRCVMWICKLLGHKYHRIIEIKQDRVYTSYSECERCGDISGVITFGPLESKLTNKKENRR